MATMKTLTRREVDKLLKDNGFKKVKRKGKGSHTVYENSDGKQIVIPLSCNKMLVNRTLKENKVLPNYLVG